MAKSEINTQRTLIGENVYRQIFDAEVNLVKSLDKEINPTQPKTAPNLPLVRESRGVTGHGILSSRQKSWTCGKQNEGYIENPVHYKYSALEAIERNSKPESYYAAQEVRGLSSEVTGTSQQKSNIIERIQISRRERHETSLEDMFQEFGVINAELEPRIIESSESLKELLADDDKEIEQLLSAIANDKDLLNYSLGNLHLLWEKIAEHSNTRQQWIQDLDLTLERVEQDRGNLIRDTLRGYNKILERIAHLMPADVHRLLEKEAQQINSTIINNRRAYADLIGHLASADVERERRHYIAWQKRVEDWRQLKSQVAVAKFGEFIQSTPISDPPGVKQQMEFFITEQQSVNRRRLDLLETLRNMKPPSSTKSAVYQWHTSLSEVCRELETLHTKYKDILQGEYDRVIQMCNDEVERVKEQLVLEGVMDGTRIDVLLNESFLPLVGAKQTRYEYEVEKMERSLENLTSFQDMMIKSLFKFVQGAAHLWDLHEIGLARKERMLQEKLEKNRQDHDGANQVKEANLDIVMDKMRQDSTEANLKGSLQEALTLLQEIMQMYKDFHSQQVETACVYPDMVSEEISSYDAEVCNYFQVGRNLTTQTAETLLKPSRKKSRGTDDAKRKKPSSKSPQVPQVPQTIEDILTTSGGTTFYILKVPGEHGLPGSPESIRSMKTQMTFLTEDTDGEESTAPYVDAVTIDESLFIELRKHIRMEFLEHLEKWKEQAVERANSVVTAKVEELNSELDLRLHLHEPRSARAQQDVHNVRAAELIMHRERVERHCKGVISTLNEFKARFQEMMEEHDKETNVFKQSVQELESTFTSATKTHELLVIQDQVTGRVEQYMDVIRTSLRKFRQDLDVMLSNLRNSNARFRKTFKVFSEGGNFSTYEIDEFRKKLERMANKIDTSEGSFMAELEGMESKRLEAATEYAGKLEDRFKHHLFDLTFMEKVTRWLTNTQVKVKAEVSLSNSQAKKLAQYLAMFERHIDAVERPNIDKEQVTAREVQASLMPILQTFHDRCLYLNCLLKEATPSLSVLQTSLRAAGLATEDDTQENNGTGDKNKKPPLKYKLNNLDTLREESETPYSSDTSEEGRVSTRPARGSQDNLLNSLKDRFRTPTRFSKGEYVLPHPLDDLMDVDTIVSKSKKSSKKKLQRTSSKDKIPTVDASNYPSGKPKSSPSSSRAEKVAADDSNRPQTVPSDPKLVPPRKTLASDLEKQKSAGRRPSASRRDLGPRYDKKYLVFGEKPEEGTHFLCKIRNVLREGLEGLLATAEMYYRQKGQRPPTRPQAMHENFELCADTMVQRLTSYRTQAEEYHNSCIQELRSQLQKFNTWLVRVPPIVVDVLSREHVVQLEKERQRLEADYTAVLDELGRRKTLHQSQLRPALGHPHNRDELETLCASEDRRRQEALEAAKNHALMLQQNEEQFSSKFVDKLAETCETMLVQFDAVLTIDDVEIGKVEAKPKSAKRLLREKLTGNDEEKDKMPPFPSGSATWEGLPTNELVAGVPHVVINRTPAVKTMKTTHGHVSALKARDRAYEQYKEKFHNRLTYIRESRNTRYEIVDRWAESWERSIAKIKELY